MEYIFSAFLRILRNHIHPYPAAIFTEFYCPDIFHGRKIKHIAIFCLTDSKLFILQKNRSVLPLRQSIWDQLDLLIRQ